MISLTPLLVSCVAVSVVFIALVLIRRRYVAHEREWIPLDAPATVIAGQEQLERKVGRLTPVIYCLEAVDIVLLLAIAAVCLYQRLNTVRW